MNEDRVVGTAKTLGGKAKKVLTASPATQRARLKGSSTKRQERPRISMVSLPKTISVRIDGAVRRGSVAR